ncbi:SBBP repeat-containing protein [Anabaena cylindrica FACHB-243]|uniref:Na-Ca exchanger/integrin-beta4 n=1 Tax=Anabaena cylindrica (strain ATCC 27899 / PCC 7122) TaxID=272123 RepID=K9ZQB4_ANACC|nr:MULTISPECIES: SBBP repeat-containing protein [Anabaena]AFZ60550.1 Na-Ca exchanger/integrin-beta4 [Anabaena cylindrica PCC 7122]MBD2418317.1 SBBP repeat-containing protein [Anabaena cylindrica FACHB-243]MBY5284273.1 hypothetical protein [Anabaena sp. CCAP 1446/1C]MBY5307914.1 hypothetical protein [Anabaena sp. CCAP 1446/1C]MCM2408838.1 SBBP repeat-containing protein [Anabaena sp. CCAP 1446/1C]
MATLSWKNAANGNWNLASNWTPGTIPSSADIAQITIGGTYTVLLDINRTLTGLTLGTTIGIQTLDINGYTLTLNGASTVSNNGVLNLASGTITGAGALTISSKLNWSNSTLSGTGKKTVSGTLNLSDYQYLDGTTLETSGTTFWTGNGYLYGSNNAVWNNTSTGAIDLQGDADLYWGSGNQPTFNNAGTFTKSNGTTTDESYIGFIFNNTGTVQVKTGTLNLYGGGSNSSIFSIDTGATLKISNGNYDLNTGNSVTGAGNFNIESGTTTVNAASTWAAPVNLIGGTLTGAGALTISNKLNWSGGTLSGTGKKTVSGTLNLSNYQTLDGTTLETSGATVWTGTGYLYAQNGATWNNTSTGTIDLQSDADFYASDALSTFNNAGTLTKSNGTTTDQSYISGLFNNIGIVDVKKGKLGFTGSYTQTAGTTRLSGGSLTFDSSSFLNLQGGTLVGVGTITGNVNNTGGQVNPGNTIGTLNIIGDYSQSSTGTLNLELSSATTFDKLAITGAADIGGILKLNLTGAYTPTIGNKFTVLTYGSATTKSFNSIEGIDISSSLAFAPTSTGNNLTLEVVDQVQNLGAIIPYVSQTVTDFVGDTDLFDFYRFNVTTASNVQLKLSNLTSNANVWLVDGLGRTLAQGIKAGTADEIVSSIVDAGTYYVKVFRPAAGNNANYTLQVAASTNPWPVQFGTSGQEQNSGVSNDSSGSIFAAGFTTGAFAGNTNAGNDDGYITKYNPDGSQAWIKQFGTSGTDYAIGTGNDSAGNVYTAGYTNGAFAGATNLGSNDGFITKYTSAGTLAWVKQFGTAADDTSFGISVDSNGNSYIVGKTYGAFAGNVTQGAYDAYIAKYDTNGTQTWIKQFGTDQDDETIGVSVDSNNNIYVLGSTAGAFAGNTNASGYDVFVSKYDSSGTQAWVKQLGSSGNNYANINGISYDSTGNAFITGYTDGTFSGNTSLGSYDGFVAKYSSTGTLAWVKQFGTTSEDYSIASKTDSAGNTYVTGWTGGQFAGNTALGGYDGFLAKYNTSGTRLWVKQFGTNSNDYANGLSIDNQGNIYVSGWTEYGSFPSYTNQGGTDSYIALFDTNGNQLSVPITSTVVPSNITLAVSPASVTEDGTTNLGYTFTRTGSTANALTVNYTVGGTATFNTDYTQTGAASFTSTTGTITFAAGSSTATLTVDPTADTTVEADETVALTLAAGTGYTIGTTAAVTGTITNDDVAPSVTINLSADQTIVEGRTSPQNLTYTVTLSNTSNQTITVNYATSNGTAIAGSDYTNTTGTLTFNPGIKTQVINIPIVNDGINEADETFTLTLTSPTNASLGTKTSAITTITDTLVASATTTLPTNVENLTLTGTTAINGTGNAGDNVFKGNQANNTLTGLNGNDTYSFVANTALGTDRIIETTTGGIDTIDFSGTTASVNVNLGVITSQTVNSNLKLILSANNVIENATGGTGNNRLTGNALDNLLIGGEGNDQLQGLAGNDILWGGLGDDLLNGGVGNDQYRFQGNGVFSTSLGVDYITQFDAGQDKIVLSKSTFTAITNTVGQALTNFAVVSDDALVNANAARIVYSQSTGSLFYNQDGNVLGVGKVFEFARLGNLDITLASSDFSLIA